MEHRLYKAIANAIKAGSLVEPFRADNIRKACPGFANKTYNVFLSKHALGNNRTTELFERVDLGLYKCLRPFRYGKL